MTNFSSYRRVFGFIFLSLLLFNILAAIPFAFAPAPPQALTLKWVKTIGANARTYIGPIATDVDGDGKTEIIVTGGTSDGGTDGTVTVLDGATGNVKWQVSPGGIGMHSSCEIADINNDGKKEIVVSGNNPVVLFGTNGSIYWKNVDVSSYNDYSPVYDVNGDGYCEIFVSSGLGPYQGYDYITSLSYDGKVLQQNNTSWHPCWAGLTIGDPNYSGRFLLYQGDRSRGYNPDTDPYKYGGWGVRCLDPFTLTTIWNDSDIKCSSHVPMLADVDGDGILDVVVAHQDGGLAVLNATSGAVLTTGGKYRKSLNLGFTSHSQPTVYDIDNDTHLEFITCTGDPIKVWDLYTWKLDAVIPFVCWEPPMVGDVNGDGRMEIIAVNGTSIIPYDVYDNGTFSALTSYEADGLIGVSDHTLLQDVDGDGYNELILTSYAADQGRVYCFRTPSPVKTPAVRGGMQFYSDRMCGAAEYVTPPGPKAPQMYRPSPANGATDLPISLSTLSFTLKDYQNDLMNYSVTTSPNIGGGNGTNKPSAGGGASGIYTVPVSNVSYGTTYSWTITATDGQNINSTTYTFSTKSSPAVPNWWDVSWQYRKAITIDHGKINSDQINFPLLLDITDNNLKNKAQPTGWDIVFTDSIQNKLSHQIESYDNTTGHLLVWVNIPLLSSTTDTILYMYYGNPTSTDQQNKAAVWDPNHMLVLHLSDSVGTNVYDSTVNANNGTASPGGVSKGITGQIDGSFTFDGTSGYVEMPHSNTLAGYSQGFTASFWLRLDDISRRQTILDEYNAGSNQRGWFVEYQSQSLGFFASQDGNGYGEWHASFAPTAGLWYHVTIVWEANVIPKFYVNGVLIATTGTDNIASIYNALVPLDIGRCPYNAARYLKGGLDEVRVSNRARSATWILTEYNNEQAPQTFYVVGVEEVYQTPQAPVIKNQYPPNGATGVQLNPTLSVSVVDYHGDLMNIFFRTNASGTWQGLGNYTSVGNGTYTQTTINMANYNTRYWWSVSVTDGTNWTNQTYSFTTKPLIVNWWSTSWSYRKTITIDHSKISSSQTNFPVLIDFTDIAVGAKARPDGYDFVFTDLNGTKLNHEIESYDAPSGHLTAWVNVPFLSATNDTLLYMYYGNAGSSNQQNTTDVWDTNNIMVLHLGPQPPCKDSTINANNGAIHGGVTQGLVSRIDGAYGFDGTTGYVETPDSGTLAGFTQGFTVSFWLRLDNTDKRQTIISKYNTGPNQRSWMVEYQNSATYGKVLGFFASQDGNGYGEWYASLNPTAGTWYHVTIVWQPNVVPKFYVNGAQVTTKGVETTVSIYNNSGVPLDVARCLYNSARYLSGALDEIRLSDSSRTPGWILTCFNNQKDPLSFYQIGPQQSLPNEPVISNPTPADGATSVPISTSKLSFNLTDYGNNPLNYTVTTSPSIGMGSGLNVGNGNYNVTVSDLNYSTVYAWTVNVTNGNYTTIGTFTFTTEALGPPPAANDIVFDSNFDMGNLRNVQFQSADNLGNRFYTAEQNHTTVSFSDKHWWFYFSMDNATGKTVTVKFVNNEAIDFSTDPVNGNRWPNIEPVFSYDNINWERLPLTGVSFNRTAATYTITITVPPTKSKVWLAPVPPYNIHKRDALFEEFKFNPYLTITSLGTTVGGQEVKVATITDPAYSDAGKFKSYVIAQQHAGELGSWNAEGLIRFLLSDDPTAALIRRSYIFKIVPIVNVDGVYQGVSRYTPLRSGVQYDLNRLWNTNPISNAPVEVRAIYQDIQAFKPNSFNDFHSTINTEQVSPKEALTYTWSTSNTAFTNFMDRIRDGGYPETVRAISSLAGGAFQNIHSRLGVAFSVSWENPMSELSSKPGVKLNVSDWMSWGAGWAKGNYLYFGDANATLNVATTGSGTVSLNDTGPYHYGSVVQLTAVPSQNWLFSQWTGDLTGSQNPEVIIMTGNKTVTAVFSQIQYTLTLFNDGNGSISKVPNQTAYAPGTNVTLTAIPDLGWSFTSWSGDLTGSLNPTSIIMDANKTVTAHFTLNQAPTIDSYTPTMSYPSTSQGNPQGFTVNATDPDGDSLTYEWYFDGTFIAGTDSYTFTPTSDSSGAHNVTVQVSDGNGAQANHNWYLTVDANLVMPFDTSTTPITDYSGLGNNGTPVGPTWTANGKIGGAYFFDGVNDYIRIPDSVSLDGDGTWDQITIEFWINITANQNGKRVIAKRFGGSTGGPYSYQIGFQTSGTSNRLYFDIWNPNLYEVEINTTLTPLNLNTWYHIACVYKSSVGSKICINGVDVNAVKVVTNPVGNETGLIRASRGQSLFIGCRNGSTSPYTTPQDFFSGMIDELRIYPKALNSTQIGKSYYLANFMSFSPTFAPTAMYIGLSLAFPSALFALIAGVPKRQRKPPRFSLPFI